jgi:tripartite-type tricarboxylate transporter receptor subunit TctC
VTRRRALLGVLGAFAGLAALGARAQAAFPARPARIIVPFTPGGSTDILARAIGQALSEAWRQQVIVENRPGAGGVIGAEAAWHAAPDGYTLFMGHIGTLAVNPALYPKLPYDAASFAPVALVALVPNVLVVHPGVPAKSLGELVTLAKSKPGTLTYGSGGNGSAAHLATEYFKLAAGIDIVHVPYKGTAPAVTDLIGGQITMLMTGLPPLLSHVRAGKLRAIGVASASRLAQVPDVPTIAEGGLAEFEATQWYGLVAPPRTPPPIVDAIAVEVQKALARPEVRQRLEFEGAEPKSLGPAAFGAFIRSESARWAEVIRAARIKPE